MRSRDRDDPNTLIAHWRQANRGNYRIPADPQNGQNDELVRNCDRPKVAVYPRESRYTVTHTH